MFEDLNGNGGLFARYEALSEDAQRLMCYYVSIGAGSLKKMSEHLYVISRYCFATFNGRAALDELVEKGVLIDMGKDWYSNSVSYVVSQGDFVPALWYLHAVRKDLVVAFKRSMQKGGVQLQFIRAAVKELVEKDYKECNAASAIAPEHAKLLCSVAGDSRFEVLIKGLPADTFLGLMNGLFTYWIENDIVCDTEHLERMVKEFPAMTELKRYRIISAFDIYRYVALGKMPEGGIYESLPEGMTLGALNLLCSGKYEQAAMWFDKALAMLKKESGVGDMYVNVLMNLYLVMCRMHDGTSGFAQLKKFVERSEVKMWESMAPSRVLAEDFLNVNKRLHKSKLCLMYDDAEAGKSPVTYKYMAFLLSSYLGYSTKDMDAKCCVPRIALLRHEMSPYLPLEDEDRETLDRCFGRTLPLSSIPHKAEWENVLEALALEAKGEKKEKTTANEVRLMYVRETLDTDIITVKEQTRLKSGAWGGGKKVSEERYRQGKVDCMNEVDRKIHARFVGSHHWQLLLSDVIEDLVGSDRLYYGERVPYENVRVDRDKPYLIVDKESDRFVVRSNVPLESVDSDKIVVEQSPTHYIFIELPDDVRNYYAQLLGQGTFPLNAEQSLKSFLPLIGGKVEVHSDLIEGGSTLETVDGVGTIGFKLRPRPSGSYEVELFVRPLPGGNRLCRPAEGDEVIVDENEEGRVRVNRNLRIEESNLCTARALWEEMDVEFKLRDVYSPEFVLMLVEFIQRAPDLFYAEWPEGQAMRIKGLAHGGTGSWHAKLTERGQWFDIEGEVQLDEGTMVSVSQLLDLIGQSNGRFVKLGEGEFLALSDKLKRQLMGLYSVANRERGKIAISPFSAALMSDDMLNGEISITLNKTLRETRQRIKDSSDYAPDVPKELNATLRSYQLDGYHWMARLNSWGAGALLADDMGLGKTIQTIAFLLLKKEEGPSLVVAPASVAPNWLTEIEKFAPSLNASILNFAPNRQQAISEAKAGDVLITTYGILLSIQDDITSKDWNVACLDEAHIIKNRGAKTSAAAMKIKARNRVMLTGTPVQNHLGELWSLFQFVNPGLLGGYENFTHKFIIPIEGRQDKEKQELLDRIVRPFMLRRTKQAVLKELPEKTEIYHQVDLTKEELAVYENIRKRAEQMLKENMKNKNGNEVDMNVLAEITRLRQASCSVQLVEPKWRGDSSKVVTLLELLQGVLEGGNRALVFSQFVSFFDIVRKELDKKGMKYYYIDGSVPVKKRAEMVDAFQKGDCPLFLISLKAGGLGLNLTGANYVFHLDPWWNPAIEQQATDRAYRIGQKQAVTVYHLVSHNTIEEKIIRLHQTKRDLADNLLDGTDMSYKLTGEDLLEMLSGK